MHTTFRQLLDYSSGRYTKSLTLQGRLWFTKFQITFPIDPFQIQSIAERAADRRNGIINRARVPGSVLPPLSRLFIFRLLKIFPGVLLSPRVKIIRLEFCRKFAPLLEFREIQVNLFVSPRHSAFIVFFCASPYFLRRIVCCAIIALR